MKDWLQKAEISADVVSFSYSSRGAVEKAEEVYVWDLDKTYLDTKFETLSQLYKTFIEKPVHKKNVPGTAALVRSLQDSAQERFSSIEFPIFFITASPPQMEYKILEKLNLDGVQPIGLYCKDNLQNLRPKRLWRLTQQVGYKLQALLQMRLGLAEDVRLIMWGDDSEADAIIYNLFSDICVRRQSQDEIKRILKALRVVGAQLETIFELQEQIPKQDPVEKIYINLAEDTDSEYYLKFGRRVFPSFNSFQTAIDLYQDRRINESHVVAVADDLIQNYSFSRDELEKSIDDLVRRQSLGGPSAEVIIPLLKENGLIHDFFKPSLEPKKITAQDGDTVTELEGNFEPWVPDRIDYLHNYR